MQAYRFALDPTPAQERALRSHAGAARFAWNWGLARCQERYAAERKWYSAAELHKLWNVEKKADPALAWWAENSKCAYQEAFRDLDRALRDYIKSKKGERKGRRLGFPRLRSRGSPATRSGSTGRHALLGEHRDASPARHDPHPRADGQALPQDRGRHGAHPVGHGLADGSALVRVVHRRGGPGCAGAARQARARRSGSTSGVKTLLTGVDDRGRLIEVAGPKSLRAGLRRLRRACRAHSRKRPGSAGRRKSAARLARIHARVANVRADALHKATTALAARYETVVAEDLNVTG